jgi:hypothetical protein
LSCSRSVHYPCQLLINILSFTFPLAAAPPVLTPITFASKPVNRFLLLAIIVVALSPFTKRAVDKPLVVVPVKVI